MGKLTIKKGMEKVWNIEKVKRKDMQEIHYVQPAQDRIKYEAKQS